MQVAYVLPLNIKEYVLMHNELKNTDVYEWKFVWGPDVFLFLSKHADKQRGLVIKDLFPLRVAAK